MLWLWIVAITVVGAWTQSAQAATTTTWTGDTSSDWNTANNWSGVAVPASGVETIFSTGSTSVDTITLDGGPGTSGELDFASSNNSGFTFTSANGYGITLTGTVTTGTASIISAVDNTGYSNTVDVPLSISFSSPLAANIAQKAGTLTLAGPISSSNLTTLSFGATSVTGTVALTGPNTFTAGVLLQDGTLQVASDSALGNASNAVTISTNSGTQYLDFQFSGTETRSITETTATWGLGASSGNTLTLTNVTVQAGANFELNDVGTLKVDATSQFGTGTLTMAKGGGTLDLNGFNYSVAALAGGSGQSGTITNSSSTLSTLTVANGSATASMSLDGNLALAYSGSGTLELKAANNFSGGLTINGGGYVQCIGVPNALGTADIVMGTGATVDVYGTAQTTGLFSGFGTITDTDSGGNSEVLTLTSSTTDRQTFAGTITNNAGSKLLSLAVTSGTEILSGSSNNYGGSTTVNGPSAGLIVNGAITGTGQVTIENGGTLGGTGSLAGPVTVGGTAPTGGNVNLVDGKIGILTVGPISFGPTGMGNTAPSSITFEIGTSSGSVDNISTTNLVFNGANGTEIYIDNLNNAGSQSLANGTYDLINYSGTLGGSLSDLTLETTSLDGHTLSLGSLGSGELVLDVSGGSVNTYYYTGGTSTDFTDYHNYNTDAGSGTQQTAALSSTSDVYIGTSTPTPSNIAPSLGTNIITINSLNFTSTGAGGSVNGTGTLTIEGTSDGTVTNGISDGATGGTTETVRPQVALGATQSWTVSNSSNTLAVAGGISGGSGQTLTLNGPGTFNFSSTASGAFSTTVSSGKLLLTNTSGSALGTGALTVARGATFGGHGSATGLSSFALGSGGSGTTQVQVGSGGSDVSTNLVLEASGSSSIANTTLSFNTNSASVGGSGMPSSLTGLGAAGTGNELEVGTTAITFGSGVTFSLTLQGDQIIQANTPYVLVAGTGGNGNGTLAGSQYSGSGLTTTTVDGLTKINGLSLTFTNDDSFYSDNSFLFLVNSGGVDDIEVEVVPEPGTWAMMIGGLAMLIFFQTCRRRQGPPTGMEEEVTLRPNSKSSQIRSTNP